MIEIDWEIFFHHPLSMVVKMRIIQDNEKNISNAKAIVDANNSNLIKLEKEKKREEGITGVQNAILFRKMTFFHSFLNRES